MVLVSGYLGHGGGAERQITELAGRLDREHFDVQIVALVPKNARDRHGGSYYRSLRERGVEITTIPRSTRAGLVQLARLALWLRGRRPDVVHSFLFSENWRARLAGLFSPGTRLISSERSVNSWKRFRHHTLERALARVTSRIVANAEAIRRFLIDVGRLPAGKIVVIPNGVDTDRFHPPADRSAARAVRGWDEAAFVVGHTGTMTAHKGQSQVLRAAAATLPTVPGLRVVLLGDGPERPALAALADELGLGGKIEMPGFVDDVPAVLGGLDVYVHFSREREGCSNAILEAMACGLPVVATDVGGNRELVENGVTGMLVAEEDVDGVARALRALAADSGLRARCGAAALAAVKSRFSVARMVRATGDLYDDVVAFAGR